LGLLLELPGHVPEGEGGQDRDRHERAPHEQHQEAPTELAPEWGRSEDHAVARSRWTAARESPRWATARRQAPGGQMTCPPGIAYYPTALPVLTGFAPIQNAQVRSGPLRRARAA